MAKTIAWDKDWILDIRLEVKNMKLVLRKLSDLVWRL